MINKLKAELDQIQENLKYKIIENEELQLDNQALKEMKDNSFFDYERLKVELK